MDVWNSSFLQHYTLVAVTYVFHYLIFLNIIVLNKREYNNYAFQFVIEAPSTAEELTTKFDIAFVLDDSGSISFSDFTKMGR